MYATFENECNLFRSECMIKTVLGMGYVTPRLRMKNSSNPTAEAFHARGQRGARGWGMGVC